MVLLLMSSLSPREYQRVTSADHGGGKRREAAHVSAKMLNSNFSTSLKTKKHRQRGKLRGKRLPAPRPLSSDCGSYFDDVCHLVLAPRTLGTAPSKTGFIWLNAKEPHWCTAFRTKRTHSDRHRTIGKMDHWMILGCPRLL
jgi:hypothetical protein